MVAASPLAPLPYAPVRAERLGPPDRAERPGLPDRAVKERFPRRLGRYTLFDHIGRGGMADIYLAKAATELGVSRLVVIKQILPALASRDFAEALVTEAKLASMLSHANVVKVEDLGREDGALFIAMEYVEGLDLRALLRGCAKKRVALPVEFSLRIVIEALKGLDYAHRARDGAGARLGLVHRDVSPSNVLLSFEGEVKLCDFGIARANPLAAELPAEAIVGKAGYMSPEHARGEGLDARADVFAAGIILWELLAGRRLYRAEDGERLLDVARCAEIPALPLRELPDEEALHAIARRALEADRARRYPTAAAMLHDLEEYAARARMLASPIRFGDWLLEHFGREVLDTRRARALAAGALARGPAAVIQPILPEPRLPDYDMTPSAFPVALRADPDPLEEPAIDGDHRDAAPPPALTPRAGRKARGEAPNRDRKGADRVAITRPISPRAARSAPSLAYTLALAMAAFAALGALWFLATS